MLQRARQASDCSLIEVCMGPGFIMDKLDQWREGNFYSF